MRNSNLKNPGEVEIPEDVRIAAIQGRLSFFIGNGVSRLYEIPSWDELANKMLSRLAECGKINHNTFDILSRYPTKTKISIADHYFKENLNSSDAAENLSYKSVLMKDISENAIQNNPTYSLIAKCGVKFLTTNYDTLLAEALNGSKAAAENIHITAINQDENNILSSLKKRDKNFQIFKSLDEVKKSSILSNNILVHLHGSILDEKNLIASTADYLNLYGDPEKQELLNELIKNQTVVFIGYGLEELEILDLIIRSSRSNKSHLSNQPRFFLILSLLSHELEILDLLKIYYEKQLKVTLLPFCRDKNGYHALKEVIENWANQLIDLVEEQTRIDIINMIDDLLTEFDRVSK